MPRWKMITVVMIVMIGLLLISCGGAKPAPTPPATPTAPPTPAIDASNLYGTKCVACHGANRQGVTGLGPALTPQSLAAKSDTEIKNTITNGKPNTSMMAWKNLLSPAEIEALLQLLKYTSP